VTGGRSSTPLRVIAEALKGAIPHSDGSSIVRVSPLVLRLWGEKLEEIEGGRARGAPGKSLLHTNWSLQYWAWRASAPADIDGAIRNVQFFSHALYPWEPVPTATTVKRIARKHRSDVFALFRGDRFADLKPLLTYLEKHERHGRE
jgi:hypothetical protein